LLGSLLALASGTNIADKAPGASSGYPQLSAEYVVKANPQIIFLTDAKAYNITADSVAKRPGFANVSAVKNNHVVTLDDDIAQRWGPRTIDVFKQMVDAVNAASN
jgi:iron complex transport system substrate-binding protein